MKKTILAAAAFALTFSTPTSLAAQDAAEGAPSPGQIVGQASAEEWVRIAAEDLLVMTLAPDGEGNPREVVIQLMPAPFSQGWIANIRTFARANWYDGISVNRVQDNYVVQWGDPNYDNPEATGEAKPLPTGLKVMGEEDYVASRKRGMDCDELVCVHWVSPDAKDARQHDAYSEYTGFAHGWPVAGGDVRPLSRPDGPIEVVGVPIGYPNSFWPVHCYGMVGVGRNYSPDTGSGAELYTVIGHAPRHLDRNIALVGRIISGMEHLSSLPRGKGELGFYAEDEFDKRTPILSVRVAADLPEDVQPAFEYLSTESETFAQYAEARANRRDPFFIVPAGGADICNIPVPVRRVADDD